MAVAAAVTEILDRPVSVVVQCYWADGEAIIHCVTERGEEMKRERVLLRTIKCWLCGTPYDFDVEDLLGAETLRCMVKGDERVRYLQYCAKCGKKSLGQVFQEIRNRHDGKPDKPVMVKGYITTVKPLSSLETLERNWNILVRKHLFIMGNRCQVCDIKSKTDNPVRVFDKTDRRPGSTPLQRDIITLCSHCFDFFGHRLKSNSGR